MNEPPAAPYRAGRIDAHHHFWDPSARAYPWMVGPAMMPLHRPFGPADLVGQLARHRIGGTVLVQTVADVEETRYFLAMATETGFVRGVVGWVDLTSPTVGDQLDELGDGPGGSYLVGARHQVHDEQDPDWLKRPEVQGGLRELSRRGLVFDLLVREREVPAAVAAVAAHPDLQFVVDHLAKPPIATGNQGPWWERVPKLAGFPNVSAKISGLVTEADWRRWAPRDLAPYVGAALEWFGPDRLLWGSDWPVCLLAASYGDVLAAAESVLHDLSQDERGSVFGANAARLYSLMPSGHGKH